MKKKEQVRSQTRLCHNIAMHGRQGTEYTVFSLKSDSCCERPKCISFRFVTTNLDHDVRCVQEKCCGQL